MRIRRANDSSAIASDDTTMRCARPEEYRPIGKHTLRFEVLPVRNAWLWLRRQKSYGFCVSVLQLFRINRTDDDGVQWQY